MLRIVSVFILVFYTLIAVGLSVSISFCGNKVIDIQFFQDAEYCCKTPKKCCNKVNLNFELNEEVKPVDFLKISSETLSLDLLDFPTRYVLNFKKFSQLSFFNYNKLEELYSKITIQFLYLKYCNLKICE